MKKPERASRAPKIGEVVVCEVVKPHDGIPAGEKRKVLVNDAVRYMLKEGFWKIIG
ncbi:MAG: hypothetical protein UDS46_06025 [Bacteroidales bacterium]|nr:hypothetical protein [Bacteroidales bacterium]